MIIKTTVEQLKRNRELTGNVGINEEDVRGLATLIQKELTRLIKVQPDGADEINEFSPQVREGLSWALLKQGSREFTTPHGAFDTFLTTLFETSMTSDVAPAVALYTEVYPNSLNAVLQYIPGKAANYLCRTTNSQGVNKWINDNPGSADLLINSVKDGTFAAIIRQIRKAIALENTNKRFLNVLERFWLDMGEFPKGVKQNAEEILAHAPKTIIISPREENNNCYNLRYFILYLMLIDLQDRYGRMKFPDTTYRSPFYNRQREEQGYMNSAVVSFHPEYHLAKDFDYAICIGWRYDTWEQFFYQVAHEAVHLLNPKIMAHDALKTCALDEGVAVRYAEELRTKYIPYVDPVFLNSPVGKNNSYHFAWLAASKLPDTVLRQIREQFGSFGEIDNPALFAEITKKWLTSEEAKLLSDDFLYSNHT